MSQIRILSEHLANQIAAGEVVERPASVVKELVENSLDAGATQVDVHVEGSGTRLLRVADNGAGMDSDDVLLSIERHATSKLQEEGQLNGIATLGFRGEALPSIGSVAKMTILSRRQDQDIGSRAEIRYGTLHAVHEDGCRRGTIIETRHLFGNMPARKKFLKSARTELFHIEEVIRNQALAYPETGFTLQVDARLSLDFAAGADLEQRVRQVFRYDRDLLPLAAQLGDAVNELQLSGYLLLPESAPARSAKLRILVNNRPVQDHMLRHAVIEGMQGFLMKGYQPAGALVLGIAPELVDVNVHPAKREIRFREPRDVRRFVIQTVAKAMEERQEKVRGDLFTSPTTPASQARPVAQVPPVPTMTDWHQQPITRAVPEQTPIINPPKQQSPATPAKKVFFSPDDLERKVLPSPEVLPDGVAEVREPPVVSSLKEPEQQVDGEGYSGLQLIGQLFSLYLLCEKQGQLVVVDQHAAHERILYGQLRQGYLEKELPRQQLLFPVTVELGPDHMETLEKHQEGVTRLGLETSFFGENTWVIKSVPASISFMEPVDLLHEILDGLQGGLRYDEELVPQAIEGVLASMSCKAAIKAGNRLQPQEMLELLQQMEESKVFSHCPHGRPVIKLFTSQDVERWFHRHGG